MQGNIEQTGNNQTFFRWAYPFDAKDNFDMKNNSIEIHPCYLFAVDNLLYEQKIEDIKTVVYERLDKLGFSVNKPLEKIEIPFEDPSNTLTYYYRVNNKIGLQLPYGYLSDYLTNDNFLLRTYDLHINLASILWGYGDWNHYDRLVMYGYEKSKFKYCVFQTSTTPKVDYDNIGDFEKDENGKIIEPEVEYETEILFSGITFDIYTNPKNENLEKHTINRIWNCVNGNYEYTLKEFLDFHFTKYTGNTDDFLNYLKEICTKNFNPNIASNVNYFKKVKKWIVSKSEKLNQLPFTANGNPTTSTPVENKKSHKKPYSAKVILEVIEKVNESERVLPNNLSGKAMFKEYAKVIKSIFGDKFDYDAGTLANNHKTPLDSTEQDQVFDILKQYGYDDLANQYRLKDRVKD